MATAEEKRSKIKNDMETVINGLSRNDRRYLAVHFGYIGVVGHREEHKSWKTANCMLNVNFSHSCRLKKKQEKMKVTGKIMKVIWW